MNRDLHFYINLIILTLAIYFVLRLLNPTKKNVIEGFDYATCIGKGYSKEFCVQSPTSQFGPNSCLCDNGTIGYRLLGYGGECVCNMPNFYPRYQPVYSPESASAFF